MYNSYFGNQYYPNYPQGYQGFTPQRQNQPQPQNIIQPEEKPFNDVRFATAEEAKGYIMFPNTKVMLIDRDNSVFYIKSADSIGKSTLEGYKYTRLDNNSTGEASTALDASKYAKIDDLKCFITREEMGNFITKQELNNLLNEGVKNGSEQSKPNNTVS